MEIKISLIVLIAFKLNLVFLPLVSSTHVKRNVHYMNSHIDQSVKLTCSINLEKKNFSTSYDYRILWSKELENGKDYEPLYLDDSRLTSDYRISANRVQSNKQIKWNLHIDGLRLNDSSYYICQLNVQPYDAKWLKRFRVDVYAPPTFIDDESDANSRDSDSMYVKTVRENEDLKLRCLSVGTPTPSISWYLKYFNGTSYQIATNQTDLLIRNIKSNRKFDKIECLSNNGVGAIASRLFKINILFAPKAYIKQKKFYYNEDLHEIKINCTVRSNPMSNTISWYYSEPKNRTWKPLSSHHNDIALATNEIQPIKYQLYEIREDTTSTLTSILVIKNLNKKDLGLYRCFASNIISNRTIEFHLIDNTTRKLKLVDKTKVIDLSANVNVTQMDEKKFFNENIIEETNIFEETPKLSETMLMLNGSRVFGVNGGNSLFKSCNYGFLFSCKYLHVSSVITLMLLIFNRVSTFSI